MGSDIPDLDAATMNQAVAALDTRELILGPATDGGFYCIGATSAARSRLSFLEVTREVVQVVRCKEYDCNGTLLTESDVPVGARGCMGGRFLIGHCTTGYHLEHLARMPSHTGQSRSMRLEHRLLGRFANIARLGHCSGSQRHIRGLLWFFFLSLQIRFRFVFQ